MNWGSGGGGRGRVGGGQGGCDIRMEDFGKIHKKNREGRFQGGGVGEFGGGGSGWM